MALHKCDYCGNSYRNRDGLRGHIRKVHKIVPPKIVPITQKTVKDPLENTVPPPTPLPGMNDSPASSLRLRLNRLNKHCITVFSIHVNI